MARFERTTQTERLTLRPFVPRDVDAVFTACQDSEIQRWTTVPSPYTHADAASYVTEVSPSGWQNHTVASFAT